MLNLANMNLDDFYFNNKWLSELGGQIGGKNGVSPFSVLPQKEIKSEKILGRDGEFVYSTSYQPRTFTVPVFFTDIRRIREIASWLNVKKPTDFYFKNDTVKIRVLFDSAIDFEAYAYQGLVELKFIAHDPYFTMVNETTQVFTSNLTTGITVSNTGNVESYPLIKIEGSGDVQLTINGTPVKIVGVDNQNGIYLDCLNYTAYMGEIDINPDACINKINTVYDPLILTSPTLLTEFPKFKIGNNTVKVDSGNVTKISINPKSRWI